MASGVASRQAVRRPPAAGGLQLRPRAGLAALRRPRAEGGRPALSLGGKGTGAAIARCRGQVWHEGPSRHGGFALRCRRGSVSAEQITDQADGAGTSGEGGGDESRHGSVLSQETRALLTIRGGMVQLIHWGPEELQGGVIDPAYFGQNRYTSDLLSRGDRFCMYYVRDEDAEDLVTGGDGGSTKGCKVRYEAQLPESAIYEFNSDPLGLYEEALKRYQEDWGTTAPFEPNQQAEYIGAVARELGFQALIVAWNGSWRVDAFVPLHPIDSGTGNNAAALGEKTFIGPQDRSTTEGLIDALWVWAVALAIGAELLASAATDWQTLCQWPHHL